MQYFKKPQQSICIDESCPKVEAVPKKQFDLIFLRESESFACLSDFNWKGSVSASSRSSHDSDVLKDKTPGNECSKAGTGSSL